uniref:Uncharacterized protein n=1 Tax=Timema genevievae TaxID=629358 RepID=A0A7R9PIQ0_TIMGE|nr:unnamed protein product [Timema genevievae]
MRVTLMKVCPVRRLRVHPRNQTLDSLMKTARLRGSVTIWLKSWPFLIGQTGKMK